MRNQIEAASRIGIAHHHQQLESRRMGCRRSRSRSGLVRHPVDLSERSATTVHAQGASGRLAAQVSSSSMRFTVYRIGVTTSDLTTADHSRDGEPARGNSVLGTTGYG